MTNQKNNSLSSVLMLSVFSVVSFMHEAIAHPWEFAGTTENQESIDDPYYFIQPFHHLKAKFIGGCGKASQSLRYPIAKQRIHQKVLKYAIDEKLKKHEEFTAMVFLIGTQKIYATVLDEQFIRHYCMSEKNEPFNVFIDGFQVDIQHEKKFVREIVIDKIRLHDSIQP